jgi:AraC family transcriptional activator of pobA
MGGAVRPQRPIEPPTVGSTRRPANLRLKDEPLLAEVFGFIEARYQERISLRDVASAVTLSSAYLTTSVRRKTGRTVQEWITERRMAHGRGASSSKPT